MNSQRRFEQVTRRSVGSSPFGTRRNELLNEAARAALQGRRHAMLREGLVAADAWVFPNQRGGLLRKSNLVRQVFQALRDRSGVPKIRFHDMRHTAASLLLNLGVPITTVGRILGHADAHTTLRVYAHVMPEQHKAAAPSDEPPIRLGELSWVQK